jgi:hypothetical protein
MQKMSSPIQVTVDNDRIQNGIQFESVLKIAHRFIISANPLLLFKILVLPFNTTKRERL